MIKARTGDAILLGLSNENVTRLRSGLPMEIDLTEIGLKGTITVIYGETEQDMYDTLKAGGAIHPDCEIKGHKEG